MKIIRVYIKAIIKDELEEVESEKSLDARKGEFWMAGWVQRLGGGVYYIMF